MTKLDQTPSNHDRGNEKDSLNLYGAVFENRHSLISALSALGDDLNDSVTKTQLAKLVTDLETAKSVKQLSDNQRVMQWLPLLVSGFKQNRTKICLSRLVFFATQDHEIRVERRRALAYPALLAAIVMLVFSLLTILVVPAFDNMFADFGIEVPASTKLLISLSREVRSSPIRLLSQAAAGIGLIFAAKKLWKRMGLSHLFFSRVISGNSASISDMSVLTSRLAELLQPGISRSVAISVASLGLKSRWYQKICQRLALEIDANPHWDESRLAKNFPSNMILALKMESSPAVALLQELSVIYADRVRHRMNWTTGTFAQISVFFLGIVVGFMVMVLLSPLLSLISALS